ncbi:hypothetical protein ACWIW6_10815, partial [Ursidibacter sp. B-7004-1]
KNVVLNACFGVYFVLKRMRNIFNPLWEFMMLELIILVFSILCFCLFMLLSWFCVKRNQRLFLTISIALFMLFYGLMVYLKNPYIQIIVAAAFTGIYYFLVKEYSNVINAEFNRKKVEEMKASYDYFMRKKNSKRKK